MEQTEQRKNGDEDMRMMEDKMKIVDENIVSCNMPLVLAGVSKVVCFSYGYGTNNAKLNRLFIKALSLGNNIGGVMK